MNSKLNTMLILTRWRTYFFVFILLTTKSTFLFAQTGQVVVGTVTTMEGEPISGVTVQGISLDSAYDRSAVTNVQGIFRLSGIPAGARLHIAFSHIGYEPYQLENFAVKEGDGNNVLVRLSPVSVAFDSVVVSALSVPRAVKSLTYSQQGVDPASLNENPTPNVLSALSGKVAGLQVIPPGFNTGSARIVIRGNSSITGNNQPLFVVDGVPIDNEPGDAGSIDYGNNAADINPADIADIQVLKGPNASALYGSRAANGVILITTKKGRSTDGRANISASINSMFQKLSEFPEYQNAYGVGTSFYIDNQYRIPDATRNYRSWGSPMLGQPYNAINGELKPYLPHPDNVKDFYSTAALITSTVAAEGGNKSTNYRLSYTNVNGNSVVKGFNLSNRHNINFRLQNTLSKVLSFDTKINYIKDIVNNRQYSNANGRNPTQLYAHMARSTELSELIPYKDENTGKEIGTHRNFSNPYWVINENKNKDSKDRIIALFSPTITISKALKFTGRLGTDLYWWDGFEFNNKGSVIASNPDGFLRLFNSKQENYNLEGILTLNQKLGKDFSLLVNTGATSFSSGFERRQQRVNSLLEPDKINISNAKETPVNDQYIRRKKINSAFGAASLGYKNSLYLDLTGRNDWSSTLPASHNSYFYWSAGSSLILTDLLKIKSSTLSYAKLRASYAVVGNDTDPYRLQETFTFDGFWDETPIASLSTVRPNPDLKPEKTGSFETGLSLRLFRNRITLDATYYDGHTTNQIITAQLPASSGYKTRVYNAGKIRNWGTELSLSGEVIKGKRFSWTTGLNYSKNNSRVESLVEGVPRFQLNNNSSFIYVFAEVGKPYGYLRGLGVKRDDLGRMLIADGGGLLIKDNDKAFGTAQPRWIGGFSNTFSFKGFDLGILIDAKMGGMLYSGSYSRMLVNGVIAETLNGRDDYYKHAIIFGESGSELTGGAKWDAYFQNGQPNNRFMSPQNYEYARPNYAEFALFDASYIKLREASLGHQLPAQRWTSGYIKNARVSLVGRNLAILYRKTPRGIDPESTSTSGNGQGIENGALPPNIMYGANLILNF